MLEYETKTNLPEPDYKMFFFYFDLIKKINV
jgi:hypothetical protein